ncbi:MAG: flagella basal body P-ring formation protein FlgA [Proteobacteria bacterium]|nr:flagella basal body P-ring formation protein FlgA [Pseudomonadota bacterium]
MKRVIVSFFLGSFLCAAPAPTKSQMPSQLEKALHESARRDWPQATRIEVTQINTRIKAPEKAALMSMQPRPALGAVSFELAWEEKGEPKHTFGTAIVKVEEPVAITTKNVNPGEALDEEVIRFESREVSRFSKNGIFTQPSELENKIARTFIRSGSIVSPTQVETPSEIKRGEMVDLLFENRQLSITARMKALDNGRTGQWIRVENQNNKRVVRAKVIDQGRVALK